MKSATVSEKTLRFFTSLVKQFEPPADLSVSEWAERYRVISPENAEPGPWRNGRTPYLVDVMDAFSDPRVRHIVMVASSQIGKTEAELNMLGYVIENDPSSVLFIHPTKDEAKKFSKVRIAPMIRDTPALRRRVADPKQRDSSNTLLQKTYPGGILTLTGSLEATSLASIPVRVVIGDERDRWGVTDEGDPWALALARQTTFYNAKSVEVSTPTVQGASKIERAFLLGSMERWKTACPHCGEYHEIVWEDIRFDFEDRKVGKSTYAVVGDVWYVCPSCGGVSTETVMKTQPSRWEAENPAALEGRSITRSFWLNAFVSRWKSWESIIREFLEARHDPEKLQVVYNTVFGKLWENRGTTMTEDNLVARREDYGCEVPDGVLVLTCGVDTQDNRLEYEVVGHGHFGETWGIKKGIIMGRPDEPSVWAALDEVIGRDYRYPDGSAVRISRTFMDEGGHFTQEVRYQCARRFSRGLFAIKGLSGMDRPYTAPPKQTRISLGGRASGTCWQYQIGVDAGKQIIMDDLRVTTPGPHYCHFPARDDYGETFFFGLLSERLVYKEKSRNPWTWEKIPGHERNEALDCRNYAVAAARSLAPDFDALAARRRRKEAAPVSRPVPSSAPAQKDRTEKRIERYYNEW